MRTLSKTKGMGQSIWDTPECSVLDAVYMSQGCEDALNASFYGTSTAPLAVAPSIPSPALTTTGVGVNVTGDDYVGVAQDVSNAQIQTLQQQLASVISGTASSGGYVPWYWYLVGGVAIYLVAKL